MHSELCTISKRGKITKEEKTKNKLSFFTSLE